MKFGKTLQKKETQPYDPQKDPKYKGNVTYLEWRTVIDFKEVMKGRDESVIAKEKEFQSY